MGKLSVPSTTRSYGSKSRFTFSLVMRSPCGTTFTSGFRSAMNFAALSTFGMPTRLVEWITWRCRFDASTTSASTMPRVPTPAAARYSAAGEPRPPAPSSSTLLPRSLACPTSPTSGKRMCRE